MKKAQYNVNIKDGKKTHGRNGEKWKTRENCMLVLSVKLMKKHIYHAEKSKTYYPEARKR